MPRIRTAPLALVGSRSAARSRVARLDGASDFVLDFTRGQLGGLVFTRAATSGIGNIGATYIDTAGYFQLAGADVPRLNCALGGGSIRGLLCEEQRTNRCLHSRWQYADSDTDENGAELISINDPPEGWTCPSSASGGTLARANSNFGSADSSFALDMTAAGGTQRPYVNQQFSSLILTAGSTWTFSTIVESLSGTFNYGLLCYPNVTGGSLTSTTYRVNGTVVAAGDNCSTVGPYLLEMTVVVNAAATMGWRLGLGTTSGVTGTCRLSRPQVENAARASSYIPTKTAAVTRAADFPSVLLASSRATGGKGTAVIRYYRGEIAAKTVAAGTLISGGADLLNIAHHDGGSANATVSDGTTTITQTNQAAGLNRAAASWTSDAVLDGPGYFALNGAAALDGAIVVPSAATSLAIGRNRSGRHLNGEIAYVALYGDCRTGAALEALAA